MTTLRGTLSLRDFDTGDPLGFGGFGTVIWAQEKKSNREVALKMIPKEVIDEKLLNREILIQFNLCHRNVIRLYNWFEDDKFVFLVLEYATGGTLDEKLLKAGHFSEKQAAKYIASLAEVLEYLHKKNIMHRDIKPGNLLLDHEGRLKLADFGLSITFGKKRYSKVGTHEYRAPEIVEKKGHTSTVDNWSLGVVCYEFLYGVRPFGAMNGKDRDERITNVDLSFPSTPPVSREAKSFIRQLLVKEPAERLPLGEVMEHPWITKNIRLGAKSYN